MNKYDYFYALKKIYKQYRNFHFSFLKFEKKQKTKFFRNSLIIQSLLFVERYFIDI